MPSKKAQRKSMPKTGKAGNKKTQKISTVSVESLVPVTPRRRRPLRNEPSGSWSSN